MSAYRSTGKKKISRKTGLKRTLLKRSKRPVRRRKKGRRRSFWSSFFRIFSMCTIVGVLSVCAIVGYYATFLPPIDKIAIPKRPPNISILAANGQLLANRGETGGATVKIEDLPPYLPNAFIAIEDRRFRKHYGIDPKGIFRALVKNASGSASMQGGSTITQQLAKNIFLTQERTVSRKIQEAILSIWLEYNYSKDEILQFYLNRVYFGSGAYGVEAAARRYFNKSATEVTLAEAAVLAGLVQAPSRLAPNRNPGLARARAGKVLEALRVNGLAPARMIDIALKNPAKAVKGQDSATANYAADYVMDILDDFVGTIDTDIYVFTTIDLSMQRQAENAVRTELNDKGEQYRVSQGALVAMTPEGAIRALVGGRDYATSQFNRAVTARRQPGSSFKPFVYLAAVDKGIVPDDIMEDSPIKVGNWQPENYSRTFFGPVTVRDALALSLNTVAVKLCLEVGPKAVINTARRLGIASPLKANATIALGTSEVTPLEMTTAFAAFANGGRSVVPYVITQVSTTDHKLIYKKEKNLSFGQVISPNSLSMMNDMLNATFEIGTAKSGGIPGWQAAGKTGTTQSWRDAWFVGYTATLVTSVWVGNDDDKPTKKASGSNVPLSIWTKFMGGALKDQKPVPLPGGPWTRKILQENINTTASEVQSDATGRHPSAPIPDGNKGLFERLFGL